MSSKTVISNQDLFGELDPSPRLLMGPGPVDVYPRVLRAMSAPMLGQFDPEFTGYMNEVMELYRRVYQTRNHWTLLVNGTARSGIEACLGSLVSPGDKVLVPRFGRFGHLLTEICGRVGGEIHTIDTEWGSVFPVEQIADEVRRGQPKVLAMVHGDTSTTMAQPLAGLAETCLETGTLFFADATATLGGMPFNVDGWGIDAAAAGLQKCMSGPPGTSPVTLSDRAAKAVNRRKHIEVGIRPDGYVGAAGPPISSNYLDLGMLMDYWSPKRLNHHTESTSMLYAARECARVVLEEGLEASFERHALSNRALRAGLIAMGLELFGDPDNRMVNVTGVMIPKACRNGEKVRAEMLDDFGIEIGTSFGHLAGKIWRIGVMGNVCRKPNILRCLASLEVVLRRNGYDVRSNSGVDAAYDAYSGAAN
ncbi:MAG: alanine--glyoxylate aminotransferase family protein [Albidovulum sp.]|nr:alanine--glyoxylate aminotransferase family protein [Albidovulum sp.]